ncbi:MAG: MMPL family transporter [Acidimicrobiales bacterium]
MRTIREEARAGGPPRPGRGRRRLWLSVVGGLGALWFVVGAAGGSYQGKLSDVQKNDNAAYLPNSAESTMVDTTAQAFHPVQTIPGFLVYQRASGLTPADRARVSAGTAAVRGIAGVASDQVAGPDYSTNGTTADISVPLVGKDGTRSVQGTTLVKVEKAVIAAARAGAPPGLVVHSAGPGGLLVAFIDAFTGIDGTLILAAGGVVVLILLVVYRSPVLWFFPLLCAGLALGAAALVIYPLAKHNVLTLNGQSQGILSVLVLGAGTDYALLLISRYREELHVHERKADAMFSAWKGAAPAIGASALTVVLGLLCLTFGELNSDRSLGPVCAIGIACTVGVMLTFLPMALLVGRWIFWPRVPSTDQSDIVATHGAWSRFAAALGRHDRRSWVVTTFVLLAAGAAITGLRTGGLKITDSFTNSPDAVVGQRIFDASFPQGAGAPAVIVADVSQEGAVVAAASQVPGVLTGPGSVCVETDYAKVAQAVAGLGGGAAGGAAPAAGAAANLAGRCPPPALQVQPVGGRIAVDAQLAYRYDTPQAITAVTALRTAEHAVPGAHALVGGATAVNYDTQQASRHDRNLIIPIVLAVILVVLGLLLRALIAPLVLILTVVLSFSAALGVSALVFNHVFHFANSDAAFPLFAFIFLVALGIDYNIFLMTRVRQETIVHGTRAGILRGLSVTGGVITSAGLVLAATFAVLGVLPLVFLAEVGFTVAFGVLLDTIVVRSILVPALSHDIGRAIWWPSRLASGAR